MKAALSLVGLALAFIYTAFAVLVLGQNEADLIN
jgi:hypothetical protein